MISEGGVASLRITIGVFMGVGLEVHLCQAPRCLAEDVGDTISGIVRILVLSVRYCALGFVV